MARRFLIIVSFAAIYLLWGSTYLAIAVGLRSIPPFSLMAIRSLCGGLVLIALCGGEIAFASRTAWLNAAVCGLLFFVGCHGILAFAQQTIPSGVAAIVLATIPFWILLIDFLFSPAGRPNPYALAALIPGFLGVAIIAWQDIDSCRISPVPFLALLAAALSWSVGTVLSRKTPDDVSSTLLSGMQLTIGGVALFIVSFLAGEMHAFSPASVSAASLAAVGYLIAAGSVIGFAAYHWLLKTVPTPLVTTYTFINPVVAVVLGTTILDEPLSASIVAGAVLVVVSIIAMWTAEHAAPLRRRGPGARFSARRA